MKKEAINKLDLNGTWFYVKDAEEKYIISDIKALVIGNSIYESMKIPSNWELAGLHNFNGAVWFIKEFDFDSTQNGLCYLHFLGVDYYTDVWLNWDYLGKHEGYFSPFSFDVTQLLDKKNILVAKVTSPFEEPGEIWPDKKRAIKGIFSHHDCRPGGNNKEHGQDQNTGGIWNDVFIEYGYNLILNNIKISSSLNSDQTKASISIEISYYSSDKTAKEIPVNFNLTSPDNKSIKKKESFLPMYGGKKVNFLFEINLPLLWWCWDLGEANLYRINISSDYFSSKELYFGIREVHLDEKQQFFINGKKLFLRGTNIIPTQFLSDFSNDKIEKIVSMMKESNINIVRVHAHVNRKEFYEECDRQGIIVWQDFSLQWTYEESLLFKVEAVKQIKEMVNHLFNHTSIAVWCCHNEPGNQIKSLDPLLENAVLSEDSTRIVRRASNYEEHAYDGWYWGSKEHYVATPMGPLVTEFGAQALPNLISLKKIVEDKNLFPPNWKVWEYHNFQVDQTFNIAKVEMGDSIESFIENSQTYQSEVLKTAIDFYRRKRFDGINGIFQFMFIDCWPSITWSVVDYYGEKKTGLDILKNSYQPVYISINLRQDQYFKEKKFLFDIYLINDLHNDFNECILIFYLNKKEVFLISGLSLKANQTTFINYETVNIIVPSNLSEGNHTMELELENGASKKIIAKNYFNFKIVNMKD